MRLFLGSAPGQLARLVQALEQGAAGAVAETAHALKGACANIGAQALAARLGAIEEQARSGTLPDPSQPLPPLQAEFASLQQALEARLSA